MPDTANDIALLQALHRKDGQAFAHVYEAYGRPLVFFAEKLTGSRTAAEDIVTDTFIKLLQKNEVFASLQKLRSFLFTVTQHAALDYLRAEKRHAVSHRELLYLAGEVEEDVSRMLIHAQVIHALHTQIAKLPRRYRTVVQLSYIEGRPITEVAQQMGLAYKTIQNLKAKAIQLLRLRLLSDELIGGAGLFFLLSQLS